MSKIIFLDVDGTLIDYEAKLPASAAKAVDMARANGHKVYICTGCSKAEIEQRNLCELDGMIGGNGAYVEDHGHVVMHQGLSKEDVKHIAFAVRDADKIANWQIVTQEFDFVKKVWLPFPEDDSKEQGIIPPEAWAYFAKHEIVPHGVVKVKTNASEALSMLCWLFDINYQYSVYYCCRLDLFSGFLRLFKQIKVDEENISAIKEIVQDYCKQKFNMDIL